MDELYPIGDVARRTGLSVSAIRFYADEGVVAPTRVTEGGFRQYDIQAVARLELVRTLRDLGAGLADIRRVLDAESSLQDLAAAHLRLVEGQLRQFRARRAVLRTIVRQRTTADQVSLMHKLVSMSDDDRDRLVDRFWGFVTDGLDVHPGYLERLRSRRPQLPEEPSAEQLEAWIELAGIVQDEQFRTALRDSVHRAFGTERGKLLATPEMLARAERRQALYLEAQAAQQAGVPANSPQARDIAERMVADSAGFVAAMTGEHDVGKARRKHGRIRPGPVGGDAGQAHRREPDGPVRHARGDDQRHTRAGRGPDGGGSGMAGRRPARGKHLTSRAGRGLRCLDGLHRERTRAQRAAHQLRAHREPGFEVAQCVIRRSLRAWPTVAGPGTTRCSSASPASARPTWWKALLGSSARVTYRTR
ncbi:MerR family transcriptional regulator [Amycolatopsis sp. CA-128772]|uniref:MerR family transcriptional regulator n=1 Tax=Amycolatopsis sp. CA-128772 TaxID=2073159 RepID=UPI001E5DAC9A|nr:MerR family transcriptional regulator [Amycolatopsis sp. CA-128772]